METELHKLHAQPVASGPYKGTALGDLPLEYLQKVAVRGVKHDSVVRNYARARVAIDQLAGNSITAPDGVQESVNDNSQLAVCKPLPKLRKEAGPSTPAPYNRPWGTVLPWLSCWAYVIPWKSVVWAVALFLLLVRPRVGQSLAKAFAQVMKLMGARIVSTAEAFFSQLTYEVDDFVIAMMTELGFHSALPSTYMVPASQHQFPDIPVTVNDTHNRQITIVLQQPGPPTAPTVAQQLVHAAQSVVTGGAVILTVIIAWAWQTVTADVAP